MGSPARIRAELEEGRRAGLSFPAAWRAVLAALEADERREWLDVLEETAPAWEAAYVGEPASRAQLALLAVHQDPERDVPTGQADPWERICAACGGPIAAGKRPDARYCSRACQRGANGRRAAA